MMNRNAGQKVFYAKLMLFGEYSILLGSSALSVPYYQFQASLRFMMNKDSASESAKNSNQWVHELIDFYTLRTEYFEKVLDLERLKKDVENGLFLDSTIPQGYGLGSSGALCAALYHSYAHEPILSWLEADQNKADGLKSILAAMESLFHGKSSGFDPGSIYLQQPLCRSNQGKLFVPDFPALLSSEKGQLFLIDTGSVEKTSQLVKDFLSSFLPGRCYEAQGKDFCELNDRCVAALLDGDNKAFWDVIPAFSAFQLKYLGNMIPEKMKVLWSRGIETHLFSMKLCGSGGGGYLMGFTPDPESTDIFFRENGFGTIPVELPFPITHTVN